MTEEQLGGFLRVEAMWDGQTWTDLSRDVLGEQMVRIGYGQPDESPRVRASHCQLALKDPDGHWTPGNAASPHYPHVDLGVPLRVSVDPELVPNAVHIDGHHSASGAPRLATPNQAHLQVTGDLDIRLDIMPILHPAANMLVWTKSDLAAGNRGLLLTLSPSGQIRFIWSEDGSAFQVHYVSAPVAESGVRQRIRFTLQVDVDDTHVLTTWRGTGPTLAGPWEPVGSPQVRAGATQIHPSTVGLGLGASAGLGTVIFTAQVTYAGRIFAAELYDGTTRVANPRPIDQEPGTAPFDDDHDNTWSPLGGATVVADRIRYVGEIASLRPYWDGDRPRVAVQAAGKLRLLGQGEQPLHSAMRRSLVDITPPPLAYWPMEDAAGSSSFRSGLPGGASMSRPGPHVTLGQVQDLPGSSPLPELAHTATVGQFDTVGAGPVPPPVQPSLNWRLVFWCRVQWDDDTAGTTVLAGVDTDETRFTVLAGHDGSAPAVAVTIQDDEGDPIANPVGAADLIDGQWHLIVMALDQSGANINMFLVVDGTQVASVGLVDRTLGRIRRVMIQQIPRDGFAFVLGQSLGHIGVWASILPSGWQTLLPLVASGWAAEPAGRRIERLCAEEHIGFQSIGDLDDTTAMGPQRPARLTTLWAECADADMGRLTETLFELGITYRTRTSLHNQGPQLALTTGDGGHVAADWTPVRDDQAVRNDVTVSRPGGGSARAIATHGPNNSRPHPDGVGRYEDTPVVNAAADALLPDLASWRLRLGTSTALRSPALPINLRRHRQLISPWVAARVGDLVHVDTPDWVPDLTLLINGWIEELGSATWMAWLQVSSAQAYTVGVYADDDEPVEPDAPMRYSGGTDDDPGLYVDLEFDAGADTELISECTVGPLWTTDPDDLPMDIKASGVRLRVTEVADLPPGLVGVTHESSGSDSWSVTAPAGGLAGRLMLMLHAVDIGLVADMGTPTGGTPWQLLGEADDLDGTGDGAARWWWKIGGDSEPGSYGLTQHAAADGVAIVVAYHAAVREPQLEAQADPAGSPITTPDLTAGHDLRGMPGMYLDLRWAVRTTLSDSVTVGAPGGGWTLVTATPSDFVAAGLAVRLMPTGVPAGTQDWTYTGGSEGDASGSMAIYLRRQSLTVEQEPINHIHKPLPVGVGNPLAAIELWTPARYAL